MRGRGRDSPLYAQGLEVGLKQAGNKSLVNVINKQEEFTFCPHVNTPQGTSPFSLFAESNQEFTRSCLDMFDHLALAMTVVVALTLLPSKTKSDEGVTFYNP